MSKYSADEFYGDFLEFNFEKKRRGLYNFLFRTGMTLAIVLFLAVSFQKQKTTEYLDLAGSFKDQHMSYETQASLFGSLGLLIILLPFYTDIIHIIRKYWLYPKQSLTQRAVLIVQAKELILHPKTKNSNVQPKTHYLKVQHPRSGRLVPVDVNGEWFAEVKEGDQVYAHYHPAEDNVLYLSRRPS
jgi:hypothetical protein